MNVNDYVGIPFLKDGNDRNGLDCWRLVVLVYREQLRIDLPDFAGIFVDDSLASLKRVSRLIRDNKETWRKVEKSVPLDVILLRTGNMVYHVGVVIGRRKMLHVMEGINSTVEDFRGLQWKERVEGFYRYVG